MYVAVQSIWGIADRVVCYHEMKEVITAYIQNSSFDFQLQKLTKEQFEEARKNDWYINN